MHISKINIGNLLLPITKVILSVFPFYFLMFTYTVVLKPKPLRALANFFLSIFITEKTKIPEGFISLNKNDPTISGSISLGVYENNEAMLFRKILKKGMVVIDVGANIGLFTVISARLVGKSGKVYSFEPEPENLSFLKKTVALNKFKNVKICPFALSDKTGQGTLFLNQENKGDHKIYDSKDKSASSSIDILTTTLDNWTKSEKIKKVDLIKMDIQGAEVMALRGMKKVLAQNKKISLITEFSPYGLMRAGSSPILFLKELRKSGFKIYEITKDPNNPKLVSDFYMFTKKYPGTKYTNLYCEKI